MARTNLLKSSERTRISFVHPLFVWYEGYFREETQTEEDPNSINFERHRHLREMIEKLDRFKKEKFNCYFFELHTTLRDFASPLAKSEPKLNLFVQDSHCE